MSSTLASAILVQHANAVEPERPIIGEEAAAFSDVTVAPEVGSAQSVADVETVTFARSPDKWDKRMEKEFRHLALREAKGILTCEEGQRLEELNYWRDQLLNPPSGEDLLLQIKRDRILQKMEELLKEYVEFQEATRNPRRPT